MHKNIIQGPNINIKKPIGRFEIVKTVYLKKVDMSKLF
jgi:hypothetical protein